MSSTKTKPREKELSSFEIGKDLFGRYGSGRRDTARHQQELYRKKLRMHKSERDIGLEVLEGIREIKRGRHGRVMTVSSVSRPHKKVGSRKS
jgi:hypothetical protein